MILLYRKHYSENTIIQEYVLPDFLNNNQGRVRSIREGDRNEQVLLMNNERFMIPEILMRPSDIGLDQAGIAEAIVQGVNACDSGEYKNRNKTTSTYIL